MVRPTLTAIVLMLALTTHGMGDETPALPYVLDTAKNRLTRNDANGRAMWAASFNGFVGGVRPPHLCWDKNRVYVTHKDGVSALDAATGIHVWQTSGPQQGLLLSDDLLLGTGRKAEKDGAFSNWLFARNTADGSPAFTTELGKEMSDPQAVRQVAGLYLIQIRESTKGQGLALLIDRKGAVRHRFDRQVVAAAPYGKDIVFLTSKDVVAMTAEDKAAWTITFDRHQWIAGGGLVDLPDGDVIAFRFGHINDSGVHLIRFNPKGGKEKWRHECQRLGVLHSEYTHTAAVSVDDNKLRVSSDGAGGTFVEVVDVKTGIQIGRTQKER